MEFFILIIGLFVVHYLYNSYQRGKAIEKLKQLAQEYEEEKRNNPFQIRVKSKVLEADEFDYDVLEVEIKGLIECPEEDCDSYNIIKIYDVTDERLPILCSHESFQMEESRIFMFKSPLQSLPYKETIISKWIPIGSAPLLFLEAPRKGVRKLEFKVYVVENKNDRILEEATTVVEHQFSEDGYQEENENREKFERVLIQTAMLVSASDGVMDDGEAYIIKDWATKRLDFYNDEWKDEEKVRLNGYIREAFLDVNENRLDLIDLLVRAEKYTSVAQKLEIFEISLDVARSDGVADEMELKVVQQIAKVLKLDPNRSRAMIDKSLPVSIHAGVIDVDTLLGIDSSMSSKEIKKVLREHYQKWNSRVTSSDEEVRKQAEEMLDLIAKARKKYG